MKEQINIQYQATTISYLIRYDDLFYNVFKVLTQDGKEYWNIFRLDHFNNLNFEEVKDAELVKFIKQQVKQFEESTYN